ncbi:hypothetical protein M404DRAFT_1001642 [Pisolithus tinctorius Marx 270]|uniref:Uncharacterized protein n=1 Tax=Pisolithus tinctorius Marx 270 TaxID=870435 RepID=A0A0C3P6L7_PISTI|nr:hypothetical protein M404DRAFT_1001642 [Pisolithus tinctorius Marx 270]
MWCIPSHFPALSFANLTRLLSAAAFQVDGNAISMPMLRCSSKPIDPRIYILRMPDLGI